MVINREIERLFASHRNYIDRSQEELNSLVSKFGTKSRLVQQKQSDLVFLKEFHDKIIKCISDADKLCQLQAFNLTLKKMVDLSVAADIDAEMAASLMKLPPEMIKLIAETEQQIENELGGS